MPNRATGRVWDRAQPAERTGLSPQTIVAAAMAVADADGLDAVSIRRVAGELGVRPMSLYTHIAAKDELVELMADELIGEMLVDDLPDDWRDALTAIARRSHAAFAAHPWALEALGRRPPLGPNAAAYAKQMAAAVQGLGLDDATAWAAAGVVNDYLLGHALRVATSGNAEDLEAVLSDADRAAHPALGSLTAVNRERGSRESFELGLAAVLDGVERRFAAPAGRSSTRRRG